MERIDNMKGNITFANEKDLIYGFKWEGSYMPKYGFCKVYKNGVVDFGEGSLINADEFINDRMTIPKEAVSKIQRLIQDNSEILSFKELENDGEFMITDAETDTFYFSDGEKNNMLSFYALSAWEEDDSGEYLSKYPKLSLLVKLHNSIREVLINFGLGEEYC